MADIFAAFPETAPSAPKPVAASIWDAYPEAPKQPGTQAPRKASGLIESAQAGLEASVPALAWRQKLPSLVMDPEHSKWWERLAGGIAQVVPDLSVMIPGGVAGAVAGTAVGGPVGGILGAGAGSFGPVDGLRTALMESYRAREAQTPIDFWNILRETAIATAKGAAVGAVTFGAGAVARAGAAAALGVGGDVAGKVGLGTASVASKAGNLTTGTADVAAQIAGMTIMPRVFEDGPFRWPEAREFVDGTAIILALKGGHYGVDKALDARTQRRMEDTYVKTGKTPAELVAAAHTDPTIAEDLTAATDVPRGTDGQVQMPTVQEALFRETARLDAIEKKANGTPDQTVVDAEGIKRTVPGEPKQFLTDAEITERDVLRTRVAELEDQVKTSKIHEESAQRLQDEIYRQAVQADQTRMDAGMVPLGDDHAKAIALMVRRNAETIAKSEGLLPEDVFRDRGPTMRDETAAEVAAAEVAIPVDAPRFEVPEVDMFGEPVVAPMVPRHAVEGLPMVDLAVAQLKLSKDVPQFKKDANDEGVVHKLGGKPDPTGWAVQVWERLNGDLEVISGRHRLDLWRRENIETIPSQIHREADGFTKEMAMVLDAELNIRDEQGSIADYVQYFKAFGLSKEAADARGLLDRAKGRSGFAIARDASPDLLAAHRAGVVSDEAALAISVAAPENVSLQNLGMRFVLDGKSSLMAVNMMKAAQVYAADKKAAGAQGDIFGGIDDTAIVEMARMAKLAGSKQREISQQINAAYGASKNPRVAREMGIDVNDPEGTLKKIAALRQEQTLWDNWPLHPELVARLRGPEVTGREGDLKQGPVDEKSPEFRLWFGDSKVVDAEGKPLVVYHGTSANINVFDPEIGGKNFNQIEPWIFLTNDPYEASNYAQNSSRKGGSENVMPVYAALQNPLVIERDTDGRGEMSLIENRRGLLPEVREALESGKYDGVIARDLGTKSRTNGAPLQVVISVRPEQIKSAIGNRGTFDPNDPNILHQEDFVLKPETPAELAARNREAVEQAIRKLAEESVTAKRGRELTAEERKAQFDLFQQQQALFQPAFHGTPHDIGPDGFRMDRIGTGEGAQAYGWGLYFAENTNVAKEYQRNVKASNAPPVRTFKGEELTPGSAPYHAGTLLSTMGKTLAGVKKEVQGWIDNAKSGEDVDHYKAVLDTLNKADTKRDFKESAPKGNIYQVDIPDQYVTKMLNWDKPLSEQSAGVRVALKKLPDADLADDAWTGAEFYKWFSKQVKGNAGAMPEWARQDDKAASLALAEVGIPGIKYLDQGSRPDNIIAQRLFDLVEKHDGNAEAAVDEFMLRVHEPPKEKAKMKATFLEQAQGYTRNLVVFDDKIIKVTHKNGEPLTKQEGADYFQPQTPTSGNSSRGSYQIAEKLITTMQGADKSTVVHELGHHFLENLKYYSSRPMASERMKQMWETARREFAIGEDGEISRASHEMNAKSFERYMGEGNAPTVELRAVFEQFRTWMLEIYNDLANIIGAKMSPEVRRLFDQMLATDQEIADARELNVPRAYVAEAKASEAAKIVTPAREIKPGFEAEQASMEPYADELPKGPGDAPDNIHANYGYIDSPLKIKLAMQKMAELDQKNIQEKRGGGEKVGVKTWAEANAEQMADIANALGGDPAQLQAYVDRLFGAPPEGRVDKRLGLLKKLTVGMATDSARLRDVVLSAGHDATVRQQLEYIGSLERMRMMQAEFLAERASVARALNALKDTDGGTADLGRLMDAIGYGEEAANTLHQSPRTPAEENAVLKAKLDEILLNYKGKSVLDIAKLHKEIGTLKGTFKFSKDVTKATTWEMVVEGWKAGLLSGPQTPVVNVTGTWSFQALRAPIDAVAALVGMARGASPGTHESDRASMSEALARITGPLSGIQDALRAAGAALRVEGDPSGKTESYRTAIPGRAGEIVRFPFRLMSAGDVLTTTMYKRGELKTLAIRQAFDEELNPGSREFGERVQTLMDNPSTEMNAQADIASTRMAFNDPGGERTRAVQTFVNKWGLQWMVPFIRTPMNIAAEMLRLTPGAPVVDAWRADILKGGVARDKAIAEVVVGSGIMALTMAYAFSGQISGSGSPDPGKNKGKAGVWQPNSILVGDTWYEIGRLQPGGTLMVLAADMANVWDHMTDEEKDKVPKILAMAFSNAITNQTFLQGITNVINMLAEPDRYGKRFFQGLAASAVPNIIGQPMAMSDPYVRQVNTMMEAIQARLPGRESLEPKIDWLGEPVKNRERMGVVLPVRETKISDDKVRQEAARLEISIADAPKKTHLGKGTGKIGDVEFTPEERNLFAKVGGEMAHKILAGIVNQPGWDTTPEMVQRKIFAKVLSASHRVAAFAALPPDKRASYLQEITEKVAAELAPAEQ